MKTTPYILIASSLLGFCPLAIGSDYDSSELENNVTSFLGTKDAKKLGEGSKKLHAITERNLACPTFKKDYLKSSVANLADATTSKQSSLIGQNITSPMDRKFTITYLSITFPGDLITYMDKRNLDTLLPVSEKSMKNLLGMKHKFDSKRECGYELTAGWGTGSAFLVIKRKE